MNHKFVRVFIAGIFGGIVSSGLLIGLYSLPPIHKFLHDPEMQSEIYMALGKERDPLLLFGGLTILSLIHAIFFSVFYTSVPGKTWVRKGLFWGFTIFLMYWIFQEWVAYHTLFKMPIQLNLLHSMVTLIASLGEGIILGAILKKLRQKNNEH